MAKEMHRALITDSIEIINNLMKDGFVKFEDPKQYLEWCQQIVANLYTGYLYSIGKGGDKMDPKEETLIAQTFNNVMLRGLLDLINTKVPDDGLDTLLHLINEVFDNEFLPEVDDGK